MTGTPLAQASIAPSSKDGATNAGAIVTASAAKWKIPAAILWGVYGIETSFGANITTSSAGAQGGFQFIPSTAKSYGYPLQNSTNAAVFAQQADAAAHYLSDLYYQTGSWDAALRHYSGGGYGYAEVQAKGATQAQGIGNPLGDSLLAQTVSPPGSTAANAVNTATTTASAIADFIKNLWPPLRLLEGLAGLILLVVALRQFASAATGGGIVGPPRPGMVMV
jgi:hypothetical protein